MKNLLTAALLSSIAFISQAQAAPQKFIADLTVFNLDSRINTPYEKNSGYVLVNLDEQTISLHAASAPLCPPNSLCPAVIIDLVNTELPIVSQEEGENGETIYTAEGQTSDGYSKLVVTDYTTIPNAIYAPESATRIEYTQLTLGGELKSHFMANPLQSMAQILPMPIVPIFRPLPVLP